MTVQTKKKIPALRFPEFGKEWEEHVLGKIADFSKGKGISKADINENGSLECVTYGELYTSYGELINEVKSRTNLKSDSLVLSDANDVIIPASGETHIDIATASCVLKAGIALGGDLNVIKSKADGVFFAYYLNNARKTQIARLAQGSSVIHLYSSQLKLLKVNLPSPPEQQKIAAFLTAIDTRIQQLTRKKTLLEDYKKGVMQQIFSQQIRFRNDQGGEFPVWEEKRLQDVFQIRYGKDYKHLDSGDIPVIGTGGIMTFVNDYLYDKPSVLIGRKGTIDKPSYIDIPFWTVDTCFYTEINKGFDPFFVFLLVSHVNWLKYNEATGVPSLNTNGIYSVKVVTPTLPEQQKIAAFLSAIDSKINQAGRQLEGMQAFKKGLLQQMFV